MKIKVIIAAAALVVCVALAWWGSGQRPSGTASVSYTRFLEQVRAGEVTAVSVTAQQSVTPVHARLRDGRLIRSVLPADYRPALALFAERGVNVDIAAASPSLWNAAPFLVLVAVWLVLFFTMKRSWPWPSV